MRKFTVISFCFIIVAVTIYYTQTHKSKTYTTMRLISKGFFPQSLEIMQNTTVKFINNDTQDRWPASNIHPTHEIYPKFDSKKPIPAGQSWDFTFDKVGSWRFHDHLIPLFGGTIVVKTDPSQKNIISATTLSKNMVTFFYKFKINLDKLYYKVFPQELAKNFNKVDMHQTALESDNLRYWLEIEGNEKVMDKLIQDSGNGSNVDCHQEAHQVGRAAFELFGSTVFKHSYFNCHSGFIHGAMESFLKQKGNQSLEQDIVALCNKLPTNFSNFECLHGIGHGVMAYVNYDMPEALKTCKNLANGFARSSCYGGVFMENILVSEGKGVTPGHTTHWVNSDPHFPCNGVDQDGAIQYECYMMQTSRMLDIGNNDFKYVNQECQKAPQSLRDVCFKSMGRDIAGKTLRGPHKIIIQCQLAQSEFFDDCINGALNVVIDFWGEKLQGQAGQLCTILPENNKNVCYQTLAARIPGIFIKKSDQQHICDTFEPNFQDLCRSIN